MSRPHPTISAGTSLHLPVVNKVITPTEDTTTTHLIMQEVVINNSMEATMAVYAGTAVEALGVASLILQKSVKCRVMVRSTRITTPLLATMAIFVVTACPKINWRGETYTTKLQDTTTPARHLVAVMLDRDMIMVVVAGNFLLRRMPEKSLRPHATESHRKMRAHQVTTLHQAPILEANN